LKSHHVFALYLFNIMNRSIVHLLRDLIVK